MDVANYIPLAIHYMRAPGTSGVWLSAECRRDFGSYSVEGRGSPDDEGIGTQQADASACYPRRKAS